MLSEVTLDPRIIGTVLQGRLFPGPAAIGAEVAAGVIVVIDLVGLASTEQHDTGQ
ncbi:hypothetical protein D3C73_1503480 [compost metagenome]